MNVSAAARREGLVLVDVTGADTGVDDDDSVLGQDLGQGGASAAGVLSAGCCSPQRRFQTVSVLLDVGRPEGGRRNGAPEEAGEQDDRE